ncbi:uncharacterized protein [Epargyreus clarus]|uniref:uncharacterized protein n=1 Tax=Epargyreus clarus TaxID=520877 RepID=UPI003C2CA409
MGNILSATSAGGHAAVPGNSMARESETMDNVSASRDGEESENNGEQFHDTISEDEDQVRAKIKEDEMVEFRKQLSLKREQRREILARHRSEKKSLENALQEERNSKLELIEKNRLLQELLLKNNIEIPETIATEENSELLDIISQMKEEFEILKSNNNKLRCDLANSNNALQAAYSDMADLSAQNTESIKQINALKEVIAVSKTMISLREQQLNQLKNKLNEIEQSLADRETNILSVDLRKEYERQLQNIRTLRGLYEERARLAEATRQALVRELEEQKILKQAEINKCSNLAKNIEELESKVNSLENTVEDKNNQIASIQEETRGLKAEMEVVNKLFSQVLLGYKSKKDLDQLVHRLEENHGLLTHMAERENDSESSSALPKLLLEIVSQVDEKENNVEIKQQAENSETGDMQDMSKKESDTQTTSNTKAEEIVQNLPKVWRVLMELLSHQSEADTNTADKVTTCYKSVETKSGPVLVPSVSQTYIRLKDLIMEKLSLIKEVNRMKQLNTHLESRLGEQEKRLCLVTTELSKTWHVVGRLRRHHHQLHTHEKILKYELQQKRKLLNELKEELEYCREKWEQAREKNTQSERDWKKLRTEFSNRKVKLGSTSINNSAESGYSDERPSDESSVSNDESEYITEPKARCKKKLKKSFETILDSSTDFNLAAEREDPASDMLDVADLPLDTQDEVHETYDISDSCNSENLNKSDKICDETEDEIGDIANDFCIEDSSVVVPTDQVDNGIQKLEPEAVKPTSSDIQSPVVIDPAAILKSIKEQNERLAKKDKKLETLEKGGVALLKKTQTIVKFSDQINSTLDHLINRPSSSRQYKTADRTLTSNGPETNDTVITTNLISTNDGETISETDKEESKKINDINKLSNLTEVTRTVSDTDSKNNESNSMVSDSFEVSCTSHEPAMTMTGNEGTSIMEPGCSENLLSKKLVNEDEVVNKLETQGMEQGDGSIDENSEELNSQASSSSETSTSEQSISNEIDHEARFAARDIRLKRLEEQTKSLVNKVNKTATKGVKINYKLQELHNIYGSDHSRSGTPSEESEDTSADKEDVNKENDEQT